uniref:NADH dehydrogenase subunit 4L n=1 Tax=Pleurosicya micheli TaxID=595630 RepID=UPI0028FC95A8|nr:NADH dehydrogenase subunit 4L [Pleurosicya micheli]WNH38102.1 NADH dehydrogenase subunit 4L [Pleurosicya micheli]
MTPTSFALTTSFFLMLAGLAFHRTHLLSVLLCLEGIMLTLFLALSLWSLQLLNLTFSAWPLLLLALSACEASVGLALLVATSRTHGTNHLKSLNLLQC